ncbi:MAG: hypothetical protein DMD81_13400 [Candidatus Rokuibacteriota bacterium]|nr:MAG: hypothetical protein DMD81_13400 [Candidatus Rokubacteria bacterium]
MRAEKENKVSSIDEIKRTTPPRTTNGTQWEVQLCAIPSREWLELFKLAGEASPTAGPQRVVFDRDALSFKSDEERVEQWIQSIDKWIASTNARYARQVESASRERAVREDAETKERERITRLNDRFKNL